MIFNRYQMMSETAVSRQMFQDWQTECGTVWRPATATSGTPRQSKVDLYV
ncbi:MAG: hypothetical protein M5U34_26850 [Chloroflexi bacterium]|nr:hypothetical protein [Chloroflexota bacterium]